VFLNLNYKRIMLREEMTIAQAVKMWNLALLEMMANGGIHPEGKYYPRNLREQFLLEWGDEISPWLRGNVPSPYHS